MGRSKDLPDEVGDVLEGLHRRYFWVPLGVQAICSAFFVAGSTMMLFEATKPTASWAFLIGSLTFAALPVIRLLNEKARRAGDASKRG